MHVDQRRGDVHQQHGEGDAHRDAMQTVAEKILAALTTAFEVGGVQVGISCSVGVATFPQDGATPPELLKTVDDLMYEAKRKGRNRVVVADSTVPCTS